MSRRLKPGEVLRGARALARRLRREEGGQTLLLGVGLICVVFALLFVAASATAVYLDLKTLTSLADSAAAAGAQSMDAHPYYGGDGTDTAPGALTDAEVRSHAAADVSAQPAAARLTGITVVSARAADSRTAGPHDDDAVSLQDSLRRKTGGWLVVDGRGLAERVLSGLLDEAC